ncbi:hypothetical protein RhiirB3_531666 [Rhizophagus irregularis]|nr:hypothetical protein RhiirB3_531666 [Rhizophagus irregularis]
MCLMCSRELGYRNSLPIGTPMLTAAQKKYNKYWHKVLPLPKNWQKVLAWAEFALMEKQHIPEVRRMLGRSPDLNSIENLWSIVKYNVEKHEDPECMLPYFHLRIINKITGQTNYIDLNYTLPAEAVYPININLLPLTDNYMMLFYDKTTNVYYQIKGLLILESQTSPALESFDLFKSQKDLEDTLSKAAEKEMEQNGLSDFQGGERSSGKRTERKKEPTKLKKTSAI